MIDIRACNVYKVIVCPKCGSENAGRDHRGDQSSCDYCNMHFKLFLHNGINGNSKAVYASTKKYFSSIGAEWHVVFRIHSQPKWIEGDDVDIFSDMSHVNNLMADRWKAHQVVVALTAGRKS